MKESVRAADKRDKAKPHLAAIFYHLIRSVMDEFSRFYFILFYFIHFSRAAEYKLCTTAESEPLCKWIEASRTEITCIRVADSVDCLLKMQKKEADFGVFYPEEIFLTERFLGDAAIVLAEVRHHDRADQPFSFETVAVVRKTLFGGLSALKGLTYCHPGFSKAQYWSDRVLKDFEKKILEHFKDDIKCNSAARSTFEDELYRLSMIFGKACRPGTWAVSDWWDKKLKRDYHSLCDQCEHPTTCSYRIQNKGKHSDALRCLTLRGGNVTYTALEFVKEYFDLDSEKAGQSPQHKHPSRYSFLCPDGSTLPLMNSNPCSWIKQPWTAIIALNSTSNEMKKDLKEWMEEDKNLTWTNHLRNVLVKGNGVLKFRDLPITVADYIKKGRSIPSRDAESCGRVVKWCTISPTEKKKCEYIAAAAFTHGLSTQVQCVGANSKIDCLRKVSAREADVVFVDAELGFISRKVYNLTAAAYLETQRTGNYYGIIVIKGSSIKKFKDLKGKKACFPRYNGLGWLTYIEAMKYFSIIPNRSCPNSDKARSHFSKVCAPGAKNPDANLLPEDADSLCKGCTSMTAGTFCEATSTNPYFGEIGALRCLNNDDGDVAFLDFHTIQKFLVSSRQKSEDSNVEWEDFKILCRDGSMENFNLTNPDKCSFIQLNGGEIVTRNDLEPVQKNDIYNTLLELDDLFGTTSRFYNPSLRMFEPFDGQANVLFKESAVSLVGVYETQNTYVNNYVKLLNDLDNCLEDSSSLVVLPSAFAISFSIFVLIFHF